MLLAIAAGEPSGDILAAGLIREVKKRHPEAVFFGIGGPKMQAAGCELLYSMDSITVMGFDEAIRNLLSIIKLRQQLAKQIASRRPDVFIGVDAPDFNIGLALKLRRLGLKTVHYVSPTVWAWRSYRIHKIKRAVDYMLVLFPFEKAYYDQVRLAASFVGHPAAQHFNGQSVAACARTARQKLGINADLVVGLMPGSRRGEVAALLKPMLAAAQQLTQNYPAIQFVLPFANPSLSAEFAPQVEAARLPIKWLIGQSHEAIRASDVMILASGTAALESLLQRTPMVVIYKVSALSYLLFSCLRNTAYFSMPNHLLASPKVPELSQRQVTADNIVAQVDNYLKNPSLVAQLQTEFTAVAEQLARDADAEAAIATLQLINDH